MNIVLYIFSYSRAVDLLCIRESSIHLAWNLRALSRYPCRQRWSNCLDRNYLGCISSRRSKVRRFWKRTLPVITCGGGSSLKLELHPTTMTVQRLLQGQERIALGHIFRSCCEVRKRPEAPGGGYIKTVTRRSRLECILLLITNISDYQPVFTPYKPQVIMAHQTTLFLGLLFEQRDYIYEPAHLRPSNLSPTRSSHMSKPASRPCHGQRTCASNYKSS